MEEWREYLEYMANRLERCANSMDICFGKERNEYKEQFDEIMRKTRLIKKDENGNTVISHTESTPEEKEIRKKYWEREEEICKADHEYNIETYRWIGEDIDRFWD